MNSGDKHRSVYSGRARLGLIVPPTNTVNEAEWTRLVPDGVTFHTTRMPLHLDTKSNEGVARLEADLHQSVLYLRQAQVDVVSYACTAGSLLVPPEALPTKMQAWAGVPCVTTAAAIVYALRALGVTRVAVATPYDEAINQHEAEFLISCGFKITTITGLGFRTAEFRRIAETTLEVVSAQASAVMRYGNPEALLLSCTDLPSLPILSQLELQFGVPVISSNSATLWASLRAANIPDSIPSAGRLLTLH